MGARQPGQAHMTALPSSQNCGFDKLVDEVAKAVR